MATQGFFEGAGPFETVEAGSARFDLPILYYRDDLFLAFFSADAARVREVLPTPSLSPVLIRPGRTLVGLAAFNYLETSIGPYGEIAVAVPVVHGRRASPLLPVLMESRYPGFGIFVMHLPVTTTIARDAGRGVWGYPKFTADMHFRSSPEMIACEMNEGDRHILTLRVPKRGLLLRDGRPLVTYTTKGTDLVRTTVPTRGIFQVSMRPKGARLELGDHPVAESMRALDVRDRPIMTRYYVERAAILPRGEVVESGVRPHEGYRGSDRDGKVTCSWEGAG